MAITGDVMYSDPQTQQDLMELHQKFENMTYIAGPLYTESWIRAWLGFLDRNQDYLGLNVTTEEDFIANLREVSFMVILGSSFSSCNPFNTSCFLSTFFTSPDLTVDSCTFFIIVYSAITQLTFFYAIIKEASEK